MTLAEGQDTQAQNKINMQIKEEGRQSQGRKPRVEINKRRCRVCGNTGHNTRTCQVDLITFGEDNSI